VTDSPAWVRYRPYIRPPGSTVLMATPHTDVPYFVRGKDARRGVSLTGRSVEISYTPLMAG
jgi:hypothetical protein